MLLNALFSVVLIAAVSIAFLSTAFTMARTSARRNAEAYLPYGFRYAVSVLEDRLRTQIRSGAFPSALPSFTPLPAQCAGPAGSCTFRANATIAVEQTLPSPSPSCDPAAAECAQGVQRNAYVREDRLSALIRVAVSTPGGIEFASRTALVSLRTFESPPYVALAGTPDEDGGIAPATPNPCASLSPGTAADTSARVIYRNAVTGACSDGAVWSDASYDVPQAGASGWP